MTFSPVDISNLNLYNSETSPQSVYLISEAAAIVKPSSTILHSFVGDLCVGPAAVKADYLHSK